jgi:hypothetical protein
MQTRLGLILAGCISFSAPAAFGWEADGSKAEARKAEVDGLLKDLEKEQTETKKMEIAKSSKAAPKWVSKGSWTDGKVAFSVGSASKIQNVGMLLRSSENRASAGLNAAQVKTTETKGADGSTSRSTRTFSANVPSPNDLGPLDWYYDEKTETLYTLSARKL